MSRSSRRVELTDGVDALWRSVDRWAEIAVDPVAVRARWSARAVPTRGLVRHIDVTADADAAREALAAESVRVRPIRPDRRALGRTGPVAYPQDPDVVAALTDHEVAHRVVVDARRYVWRGPFVGTTTCDLSVEDGGEAAVVQAWYQPVWTDGFRRHGAEDGGPAPKPPRVQQARASINRLLESLGVDALRT